MAFEVYKLLCGERFTCSLLGGSRGLVVKVLDSKFEGCEFKTHTGHGSLPQSTQLQMSTNTVWKVPAMD